eukprot:1156532-Pelagomonas_calceolata.AAC.17
MEEKCRLHTLSIAAPTQLFVNSIACWFASRNSKKENKMAALASACTHNNVSQEARFVILSYEPQSTGMALDEQSREHGNCNRGAIEECSKPAHLLVFKMRSNSLMSDRCASLKGGGGAVAEPVHYLAQLGPPPMTSKVPCTPGLITALPFVYFYL